MPFGRVGPAVIRSVSRLGLPLSHRSPPGPVGPQYSGVSLDLAHEGECPEVCGASYSKAPQPS